MPVKIFFCYAREDEQLLIKLKSHLIPIRILKFYIDKMREAG